MNTLILIVTREQDDAANHFPVIVDLLTRYGFGVRAQAIYGAPLVSIVPGSVALPSAPPATPPAVPPAAPPSAPPVDDFAPFVFPPQPPNPEQVPDGQRMAASMGDVTTGKYYLALPQMRGPSADSPEAAREWLWAGTVKAPGTRFHDYSVWAPRGARRATVEFVLGGGKLPGATF